MADCVECHSGIKYAETPVAFTWQEQRLEIKQILMRWKSPGELGFRVTSTDGQIFDLVYNEVSDQWLIKQA